MKRTIVAIVIGISAQLAIADPADKPAGKAAYADGKKKYATGDYAGAASDFQAAFDHDPDPAYIFNVGQAYRRRVEAKTGTVEEDCFKSWKAYKEFLKLVAAPPNRKEVETYIAEMERCAGKLAVMPIDKPVDKPIDKPVDRPIEQPIEQPIDKPVEPSRDPKQYVGIGIGVAGVIACGIGIYYANLSARELDDRQRFLDDPDTTNLAAAVRDARLKKFDADGNAANRKAYVSFGVGGAMVIGGTLLVILGRNSTTEQKVTVAPSRDGAMVLGSFRF